MDNKHLYSKKAYIVNYVEGDKSLERAVLQFPESDEDNYHVVKSDETIVMIAHRYYGDSQYWYLIADANREAIENPFDLSGGLTLRIPSVNTLKENLS